MTQFDPSYSESQPKKSDRTTKILLGGCLGLFVCFACFIGLGIAGYALFESTADVAETTAPNPNRNTEVAELEPTATAVPQKLPTATVEIVPTKADTAVAPPEPTATIISIGAPKTIDQTFIPPSTYDDLTTLLTADYPSNDYFETANRLGNFNITERTVPASKYAIGDVQEFYNGEDLIDAELVEITEHAYFWLETSLDIDHDTVADAAQTFESQYYPITLAVFGTYWSPGVDQDPRFSILHVAEGTSGELGRFSSIDEYPKSLYDTSNEQEIVYLSMDELDVGEELYFGTLIHELQHLIQWNIDPSEALWVNEGLSQLSEIMVNLYTSDVRDYLLNPETPLNTWNFDEPELYSHYAASYLFMIYFWEQLGDTAVQELATHPANGMAGIQQIINDYLPEVTFTQFVGNWAAANYIDDVFAGPDYYYDSLDFKKPTFVEVANDLPFEFEAELDQFGVNYIDLLDLRGPVQIKFAGDTLQNLSSTRPPSGNKMWFAPAVDEMDAQLTAAFDLSDVTQATLEYAIWYDLEPDYDYAYVSASTDNGTTWDILLTDESDAGEFGPAYNGSSTDVVKSGWLNESISLNEYVGQTVLIRFEVLTDSDITNLGVAIDDIAIPELNNYLSTVEENSEGWQSSGFVPVGYQLPQQWSVQLIQDGPEPTVTEFPLSTFNQGILDVEIGKGGAVLVIVPTTPFTRETANYWVSIETTE